MHKKNLANARIYVTANAPYLVSTLYAMVPTPVENLARIADGPMGLTEHLVLLYDPAWVSSVDTLELAGALVHEIMHDVLGHATRAKAFPDRKLYNLAADLFINHTLRTQVRDPHGKAEPIWRLPEWVQYPEKYGLPPGLSADQYYALLEEQQLAKPHAGESTDKEKGGDKAEAGENKVASGGCGGVVGNPIAKRLEAELDKKQQMSHTELHNVRKETQRALKEAAKKQQGILPLGLDDLITLENDAPKIRWSQLLRCITGSVIGYAKVGALDYSTARPSRRSHLRGWPIPGVVTREIVVLIVLDTSGSMRHSDLNEALREVAGVMRQVGGVQPYLLQADSQAYGEPVPITLSYLHDFKIKGRGGTDFRPAFKIAEKMRPRPNVLIYMTDGYGTAPLTAPNGIQTIWCLSEDSQVPASWGYVVKIPR